MWAGSRSALNVVVGGVTLVALVALYMHRIRAEEQLLGRELGDAYTEYAKRSWRLLPGIW